MINSESPQTQNKGESITNFVRNKMVMADDPLAMVQQTLASMQPPTSQVVTDPRVKKEETPQQENIKSAVDEILTPSFSDKPEDATVTITKIEEPKKEEEKKPEQPVVEEPKDKANPLLDEVKVKKGPEESIKDLRKKSNEYKSQLEERESRLAQLEQKIQRYESGEATPEKIEELSTKLQEVEKEKTKYEQLHALKLSKEYQTKYVDAAEEARQEARELARDYKVDPSVFDKAWEIDNKRDLNAFLRKHFNDDVGALEAREILTKLKSINQEAFEAEQEPARKLAQLKEEYAQKEHQEAITRTNNIKQNAKSAWSEAITTLRESGQYPEFEITGDLERDKVTKPLVEAASSEYGKFVTMMGNLGMKELPKEAAAILAKRFLLSQVTPLTAASRAAYYRENQDVLTTAKRENSVKRPQVGGGAVNSPSSSEKPRNALAAADMLIEKVLQRR